MKDTGNTQWTMFIRKLNVKCDTEREEEKKKTPNHHGAVIRIVFLNSTHS